MLEELVPMVVCTGMFATIFGIFYIRSRENMAMIERGLNPRTKNDRPQPFVTLKYGLLMLGSGLGLLAAYLINASLNLSAAATNHFYETHNPAVYFALIAVGGGLGLVISYVIEKKWWDKKGD